MMWFGKAHGAAYEADTPHAPTPADVPCGRCGESIEEHDDGMLMLHADEHGIAHRAYHYACHMRGIIGGLNHLAGRCVCCGGTEPPDPPTMTKRQAASAAVREWQWTRRALGREGSQG